MVFVISLQLITDFDKRKEEPIYVFSQPKIWSFGTYYR